MAERRLEQDNPIPLEQFGRPGKGGLVVRGVHEDAVGIVTASQGPDLDATLGQSLQELIAGRIVGVFGLACVEQLHRAVQSPDEQAFR